MRKLLDSQKANGFLVHLPSGTCCLGWQLVKPVAVPCPWAMGLALRQTAIRQTSKQYVTMLVGIIGCLYRVWYVFFVLC